MKLQELVNKLSNKLASTAGDTSVYIRVEGNQEIVGDVIVEDAEQGQVIIVLK